MFDLAGYPNGTVIRVTSDRFGPGVVGAIGTITDRYLSGTDGLAYAVILEGSLAGTFYQCGEADFEVVPRGTTGDPFTEGKRGDDVEHKVVYRKGENGRRDAVAGCIVLAAALVLIFGAVFIAGAVLFVAWEVLDAIFRAVMP